MAASVRSARRATGQHRSVTTQPQQAHVADGIATALLAGPWTERAMLGRARHSLGRDRAPRWLRALVAQVVEVYRDPPVDRPRELAAVVRTRPAWALAWQHRRTPRMVAWTPVATSAGRTRWPVAPLDDLGALARLLDIDMGELEWFADVRGIERSAREPLRHYRWHALPKAGGVRLVAAPKPRLKELQRRLLRHVAAPIPVHDAAHGCEPGRSVRSALLPHSGSGILIRFDLEGFFAHVRAGRIWSLLCDAGLPESVAHTVTGLVTTVVPRHVLRDHPVPYEQRVALRTPHLPTGAPTSPALANRVAFSLDRRLAGLASSYGARYTGYVDDLIFSGGGFLRPAREHLIEVVERIVTDEGFRLNDGKTRVLAAAGRQHLLGAVTNVRPTLPRPDRDALRATLHNCVTHGWRSQAREVPDLRAHLMGRIAALHALDPVGAARLRSSFDAIDWS
jgi:RNA-directed DNA polymerase